MGISRDITKLIDTTKVYNPALAFEICRGDTVNFSFTFNADISSATLARIFAKPLKHNGVNHNDNPLFAAEITLDNPTGINHTIASAETASDAGEYLLSIVLLDASENTVTATTIPFALFEQGYSGIYTPSADFRDELLTTCYNAISAAENTAYYASEDYNTNDSI